MSFTSSLLDKISPPSTDLSDHRSNMDSVQASGELPLIMLVLEGGVWKEFVEMQIKLSRLRDTWKQGTRGSEN